MNKVVEPLKAARAKFTPGPWTDGREILIRCIQDCSVNFGISCSGERGSPNDNEYRANAQLISVSPEMFEALDGLCGAVLDGVRSNATDEYIYDELGSVVATALFRARDVLSKATSSSSPKGGS